MPIIDRRFSYRGKIGVSSGDLELARRGLKRCTIRLGVANVLGETISLSDRTNTLRARITNVDSGRVYRQLTDEDAIKEGFLTKAELDHDLRQYYGKIEPEQPITVIEFEVVHS
jgi:hypothetical protein